MNCSNCGLSAGPAGLCAASGRWVLMTTTAIRGRRAASDRCACMICTPFGVDDRPGGAPCPARPNVAGLVSHARGPSLLGGRGRRLPVLLLELVEERLAHERHRQEPDFVHPVVEVLQRALLVHLPHLLEVVLPEQHP